MKPRFDRPEERHDASRLHNMIGKRFIMQEQATDEFHVFTDNRVSSQSLGASLITLDSAIGCVDYTPWHQ